MKQPTWVIQQDTEPSDDVGLSGIRRQLMLNMLIYSAYLAAAAGYGAWLGEDFRSEFQGAWITPAISL